MLCGAVIIIIFKHFHKQINDLIIILLHKLFMANGKIYGDQSLKRRCESS